LTEWKGFGTTVLIVSNISCLCRADEKVNTISINVGEYQIKNLGLSKMDNSSHTFISIFNLSIRYYIEGFENTKEVIRNVYRTLKRHISIGVVVVYIDTGSPVRNIPSNLCDLADENNEILTEWR
jgi:F420-0:gamma-glutamyl ligase-like protein